MLDSSTIFDIPKSVTLTNGYVLSENSNTFSGFKSRYLHLNGVTHRDLKPEKVLLFFDSTYPLVKVTDFGISKIVEESSIMETLCGTISYVAPEVLKYSEPYNKKVDVWSFGVILFHMLSKTHPFGGEGRDEVARNILSGKIYWDVQAWKGISNSAKDLTKRMITVDPKERVSTADVFKQDWIEKDASMRYRVGRMICDTFGTDSSEEVLSVPDAKRARLSTIN